MRSFESLTEREILALAVSLEEEDERIYSDFAEGLRPDFAATAEVFDGMRGEESGHRRRLIDLYRVITIFWGMLRTLKGTQVEVDDRNRLVAIGIH